MSRRMKERLFFLEGWSGREESNPCPKPGSFCSAIVLRPHFNLASQCGDEMQEQKVRNQVSPFLSDRIQGCLRLAPVLAALSHYFIWPTLFLPDLMLVFAVRLYPGSSPARSRSHLAV